MWKKRDKKKKPDRLKTLLTGASVCFAALLFSFNALNLCHGVQSYFWPVAKGQVISSSYESSTGTALHYSVPKVLYLYTINDKQYVGTKVWYSGAVLSALLDSVKLPRWLGNNPTGGKITVHYKPTNPMVAVVDKGVHLSMLMDVSLIFALLLYAYGNVRQPRVKESDCVTVEGKAPDKKILDLVKSYAEKIEDNHVFFYPWIPRKKLGNAITSFASDFSEEEVPLVLVNEATLGGGKKGCLITDKTIYSDQFDVSKRKSLTELSDMDFTFRTDYFIKIISSEKESLEKDDFLAFNLPKKGSIRLLASILKRMSRTGPA